MGNMEGGAENVEGEGRSRNCGELEMGGVGSRGTGSLQGEEMGRHKERGLLIPPASCLPYHIYSNLR